MGISASAWKGHKIIALVGPTGCGKSRMIDCLSESTRWAHGGLNPSQEGVREIEVKVPNRKGHTVILVDTPGFDGVFTTAEATLEQVKLYLRNRYRKDVKLAGILYLHCITDNRVVVPPPVRLLTRLCDGRAAERVVFVTTMWDSVTPDRGVPRERELSTRYWKSMVDAGSPMTRFENTTDSAWDIVKALL